MTVIDVQGRDLHCCGHRLETAGLVCLLLPGHGGDHKAFGLWPESDPQLVGRWPQ